MSSKRKSATQFQFIMSEEGLQNFRNLLAKSTDYEKERACLSYQKYKELNGEIANLYGYHEDIGAAVFAALSPNNDYWGNLRDCHALLKAHRQKKKLEDFKVSTYGNNKRKAWDIAGGKDALELIVAPKTRSFYLNIVNPFDPVPVTIDGHMLNIWRNKRVNLVALNVSKDPVTGKRKDRLTLGKSTYEKIAEGVRIVARENQLIPNQLQAILWTTWRRVWNIQKPTQPGLFDLERIAARLMPLPA